MARFRIPNLRWVYSLKGKALINSAQCLVDDLRMNFLEANPFVDALRMNFLEANPSTYTTGANHHGGIFPLHNMHKIDEMNIDLNPLPIHAIKDFHF